MGFNLSVRFVAADAIVAIIEVPMHCLCAAAGWHPKLLRQRKARLNPASTEDYFIWIEDRRRQIRPGLLREKVSC